MFITKLPNHVTVYRLRNSTIFTRIKFFTQFLNAFKSFDEFIDFKQDKTTVYIENLSIGSVYLFLVDLTILNCNGLLYTFLKI